MSLGVPVRVSRLPPIFRIPAAGNRSRTAVVPRAVNDPNKPSDNAYSKVYSRKATWEGTFGVDNRQGSAEPLSDAPSPPWEAVGQLNEAYLVWSDELETKLLKAVVAEKVGISEAELDGRLLELQLLVPDLTAKLPRMKAKIVAELVADTSLIAKRLVNLKSLFPGANISRMCTRLPTLLTMADSSLQGLQEKSQQLREALPGVNIDVLVSVHPTEVLKVESFLNAIEEARRLMPSLDIHETLKSNPSQIFSFQRGDALIPYDDVKELW